MMYHNHHDITENVKERLLCYSSDTDNSAALEARYFCDSDDVLISSISEINQEKLDATQRTYIGGNEVLAVPHKQLRNFCFVDTEVMRKTTGLYSYRVELDIQDKLPEMVTELCVHPFDPSIEKLIRAYDHVITYIEQNVKFCSI